MADPEEEQSQDLSQRAGAPRKRKAVFQYHKREEAGCAGSTKRRGVYPGPDEERGVNCASPGKEFTESRHKLKTDGANFKERGKHIFEGESGGTNSLALTA